MVGRVAARTAGATQGDIPLLKLTVTANRGTGQLAAVTSILRLKTRGGTADGPCTTAGTVLSVPYAADYDFLSAPR